MGKKTEEILEKINSIDKTLVEQHVTLKEHVRRTELLETEMRPVKTHISRVEGALKILALLASLLAAYWEYKK